MFDFHGQRQPFDACHDGLQDSTPIVGQQMNFIDHQQTNGPQQCFAVRGKPTTHGVELLRRRDDDVAFLDFLHVMGAFFFNGIAGQFADTEACGKEG